MMEIFLWLYYGEKLDIMKLVKNHFGKNIKQKLKSIYFLAQEVKLTNI